MVATVLMSTWPLKRRQNIVGLEKASRQKDGRRKTELSSIEVLQIRATERDFLSIRRGDEMANYILGAVLALLVLSSIARAVVPMIEKDLHDQSKPRAHFYSASAWGDCAAMGAEARAQGFKYWACHNPTVAFNE